MLTKPEGNVELLKALHGHTQSAALVQIVKFFEAELADARERLEVLNDPIALHRMQGRAQFASEFLALVRDAPSHLEKLQAKKP